MGGGRALRDDGKQFTYQYNQYGQKIVEINLNDVETDYTYGDSWGNLTQTIQDPGAGHLNRTTAMVYDAAGRVVSSTDPKNQASSFQFNGVGQPLTASLPGEAVTYGYGTNGRTESVTDNRGTTTIAYETGNDRVSSVTDPVTGQVGYTYNVAGQRLTMSLPGGGTWSYTYSGPTLPKDDPNSAAQGLTTITDDQNRVVNYYLDTLGQTREVWSDQTFTGTQLTNSRGVVDHVRPGEMGDGRPARMERDDGCGGHCRANGCDTVALQRHW